jgi:hypothetical protein
MEEWRNEYFNLPRIIKKPVLLLQIPSSSSTATIYEVEFLPLGQGCES